MNAQVEITERYCWVSSSPVTRKIALARIPPSTLPRVAVFCLGPKTNDELLTLASTIQRADQLQYGARAKQRLEVGRNVHGFGASMRLHVTLRAAR